MKKVVRMLGLCALVALAFTSCKKKETSSTVTFKASITQPASENRTYLDALSRRVYWSGGDEIRVFNDQAGWIKCSLPSDFERNKLTATFEGDADFLANLGTENSYTAFYPVNDVNGESVSLVVSNEQPFEVQSFATNLYPMYAVNDTNGDFAFQSNAGLLCFNVRMHQDVSDQSQWYTVSKVILTSDDPNDQLVGTMVYPYNYPLLTGDAHAYDKTGTSNEVSIINCGEDPISRDGRVFNFVLLEGALHGGTFSVVLLDENNQPIFADPIQGTMPTINYPGIGDYVGIVAQKRIFMADIILPAKQ